MQPRSWGRVIWAVAAFVFLFWAEGASATQITLTVDKDLAPVDNPLKGFMPYADQDTTFPSSLEWFYVPMKDLMDGENSFTLETGLEPKLAAAAARGHQAVFRVYLDYPSLETGIPQFLLDSGLTGQTYSDYGGGWSPDYSNADLVAAMVSLINKMGDVYNGDPRIGFITVGFLGFWGEWHTYPYEDWFASRTVQETIITAMTTAFPDTRLLLRNPSHYLAGAPTGYHDDSFAYSTLATVDWHFMGLMESAGETERWQSQPIGGEVYPDLQEGLFDATPPADAEDFAECIDATHVSWLLNYTLLEQYGSWDSDKQARATSAARNMGYTLAVSSMTTTEKDSTLTLAVSMTNLGVAPFYYDWPVLLELRDNDGSTVKQVTTGWALSSVLPGDGNSVTFSQAISVTDLADGTYQIVLQVPNPMDGGRPVLFANEEQQGDGDLLLGSVTLSGDDGESDDGEISSEGGQGKAPLAAFLLMMQER